MAMRCSTRWHCDAVDVGSFRGEEAQRKAVGGVDAQKNEDAGSTGERGDEKNKMRVG